RLPRDRSPLPQRFAGCGRGERGCVQREPPTQRASDGGRSGERMTAGTALGRSPSRDDFAALLEESFLEHEITEGSVVKGRVVAIEKDVAVIDIGAKTEGRVALKEFTGPGREGE